MVTDWVDRILHRYFPLIVIGALALGIYAAR